MCECRVEPDGSVIPIRIRPDKQYGNNITVAYDNYASAMNPLTIPDMFGTKNSYFAEKDELYEKSRRFHREVKYKVYGEFMTEGCRIIDVGAGKGQDIN